MFCKAKTKTVDEKVIVAHDRKLLRIGTYIFVMFV